MRSLLISQRVDVFADRRERRDSLDQRLVEFVFACGYLPYLVPNIPAIAAALFQAVGPAGLVLSGGNDLVALGGTAPERDATEEALVAEAEKLALPVFGICRGLQFLTQRSGGVLVRVEGHVASRHQVRGLVNREINSFHNWGIERCGASWEALAKAEDGSVEFARCVELRQSGIMWHPERETQYATDDIALFKEWFDDTKP